MSKPPAPNNMGSIYCFIGKPAMRTRWIAGIAPHKSGRCRDLPRSDNYTQQVYFCDICHKQIYGSKQISIRCNRFEHWVYLRCSGIRIAQYTYTWTYHLYKEYRFTTHTYIKSPTLPDPLHGPSPKPTPPTPATPQQPKHRYTSHTLPVPTGLVKLNTQSSHPLTQLTYHPDPGQTNPHFTHSTYTSHPTLNSNCKDRIYLTKLRC